MNFTKAKAIAIATVMVLCPFQAAQADSFDNTTGTLLLNYVRVGTVNYQIELRLEADGSFKIVGAAPANYVETAPNVFDASTGLLSTSIIDSDGAQFRGDFQLDSTGTRFVLVNAETGVDSDGDGVFDDNENVDGVDSTVNSSDLDDGQITERVGASVDSDLDDTSGSLDNDDAGVNHTETSLDDDDEGINHIETSLDDDDSGINHVESSFDNDGDDNGLLESGDADDLVTAGATGSSIDTDLDDTADSLDNDDDGINHIETSLDDDDAGINHVESSFDSDSDDDGINHIESSLDNDSDVDSDDLFGGSDHDDSDHDDDHDDSDRDDDHDDSDHDHDEEDDDD